MPVLCPASEKFAAPSGPKTITRFPTKLLGKTASRVYWLALLVVVSVILFFCLHEFLSPEIRSLNRHLFLRVQIPLLVVPTIAVIIIHRLGFLAPIRVLELSVVFEVFVALGLAVLEFARTQVPEHSAFGMSLLPMWILVFGVFVPNTPVRTLLASLVSACTGPAAYFICKAFLGTPAWESSDLILWFAPAFVTAGWTYLLSRDMYQMEISINAAREMGSYSLEKLLGRGGMGEVWAARHRTLCSGVAVKLIRPEVLVQKTGREAHVVRKRFEQEARATARLRSPHTVTLHDFGVAEDGSFYYAMELLEGLELDSLVTRFGPQPATRVVFILRQACESLAEAHSCGLIHRDIKPSNIFLAQMGLIFDYVKVLDFGLVKSDHSEHTQLTTEGTTAGTPAYMAPELAAGELYDARADIYSLGCVGYFLLTGAPVFEESNPVAVALAHIKKEPVRPSQRTELAIPESVERVMLRCLAKNPADRPQSAVELARSLESCESIGTWTREDAETLWRVNLPDILSAPPQCPEALSQVR